MTEISPSRAPAYQHYAADYLADESITLMSLEQEGALHRAKSYCWREGSIPADPEKLSRLLKNASAQTIEVVRSCFKPHPQDSSRLIHTDLERERAKQREWREKSAAAGKASGKSRRAKKFSTEPNLNQRSDLVEPKSNSSFAFASSFSSSKENATKTLAQIDKKTIASVPDEPVAIFLPLVDKSEFGISQKLADEFANAYPGISVIGELNKIRSWLISNPTRKKTRTGIMRFINSWLSKAQNEAGQIGVTTNGRSYSNARTAGNASALAEVLERQRNRAATDEALTTT